MRVSVLMTAHNPGRFFRPAVESILSQTFRDFELVLVDDGSSDGTKEIARNYAEADSRVKFIDEAKNIGRTPALNAALDAAKGEYIAVMDADDVTAPDRLALQVAALDADPSILLVAGGMRFIDENDAELSRLQPPADPAALYETFAYTNLIPHSGCMFRRSEAVNAGGYPRHFVFAQDFGLILALARRGKIAMLPQILVDTREHGGRMTRAPQIAFNRLFEELELFEMSRRLPGLSRNALQRNGETRASLHFRLAKLLLKNHSPAQAAIHLVRSFAAAPVHCLKRLAGGAPPSSPARRKLR